MGKTRKSDELAQLNKIKSLALEAIFSDDTILENLVLKGGNALDIGLGISTRASIDLDFSMADDFESAGQFSERIRRALVDHFGRNKFVVFDFSFLSVPRGLENDPVLVEFWGGYRVEFKVISQQDYDKLNGELGKIRQQSAPIIPGGGKTFQIDISKHEYSKSKKIILLNGLNVAIYTPAAIVAEKVRAICQQMVEYEKIVKRGRLGTARARDFMDIFVVCSHSVVGPEVDFASVEFHSLIKNVFAAKRVPLHLIGQIQGTHDMHAPDFQSVLATIKTGVKLPSQDFETYFSFVVQQCDKLKPLWDK